jgi:arginine/lysine/ornithine decarboxylase
MSESLFHRLRELAASDFYPFHTPGHKRFDRDSDLYALDISEILGFDNLHYPEDIIAAAQKKAAALYGATETFFLINGSTAGILSAISTVCAGGAKKLLISRHSHISVYHCAYLHGLSLLYIYPQLDEEHGWALGITAKEVADKLKSDPDVAAVLITSPTYEGIESEVAEIAEIAHRYEIPLIVDQAHGAHFGFHPAFPESAVRQGADLVLHSLHKTLPALTQSALLHIGSERISRPLLARYLRIFQTSSPSYLLMAGIERCLDIVEGQGATLFTELLRLRAGLVDRISQLKHFHLAATEPCKLVIVIKEGTSLDAQPLNGARLNRLLHERFHLEMEMAAENYVVAIATIMDREEGFDRLARALEEIDSECQTDADLRRSSPQVSLKVAQGDVRHATATIELPLTEAIGRAAAEFVVPYPPGIPLLVPGERIDSGIAETLAIKRQNGFTIHGLNGDNMKVIVYAN